MSECPNCGGPVDEMNESCPNCGQQLAPSQSTGWIWLFVLLGLPLACCSGCFLISLGETSRGPMEPSREDALLYASLAGAGFLFILGMSIWSAYRTGKK